VIICWNAGRMRVMMRQLLICSLVAGMLWIGALAYGSSDDHGLPHAVAYDLDTFNAQILLQPHFVMFYAPWFVSIFTVLQITSMTHSRETCTRKTQETTSDAQAFFLQVS